MLYCTDAMHPSNNLDVLRISKNSENQKMKLFLEEKMISSRQVRNVFVIAVLTIMFVATVVFNFGTTSAWAAPLPSQLGSQSQLATMNRAEAMTKNLEGKAQEAIGNVTGDPKDQMMGKAKQAESQVRNAAEDVKDQFQPSGRVNAAAKNVEGKAQEAMGNTTGNAKDQMMGKVKQAESRNGNVIEDMKDRIQNIFN
jgi:uncharacterized protein YjbJ (UPF0337 family)